MARMKAVLLDEARAARRRAVSGPWSAALVRRQLGATPCAVRRARCPALCPLKSPWIDDSDGGPNRAPPTWASLWIALPTVLRRASAGKVKATKVASHCHDILFRRDPLQWGLNLRLRAWRLRGRCRANASRKRAGSEQQSAAHLRPKVFR